MCSYSSVNWLPVALSPMLNTLLRRKLNFDGFVISDYDELTRVKDQQEPTSLQTFHNLNDTVPQIFNSGIDMMMFSSRKIYDDYIEGMKQGLKNSTVLLDRLNDAVARIISVKLALGIAKQKSKTQIRDQVIAAPEVKMPVSATTEYEDSLQAVHESLVLLKNANILPVKASTL